MRRIEQSILYDILDIGYDMILLFEIHSIGDGCLFWLFCLIKRITTNNSGSLYMEQRMLAFFLFYSPHHMVCFAQPYA